MMFSTKFFMFPASNLKGGCEKSTKSKKIYIYTQNKLPWTFDLNFTGTEGSNKPEMTAISKKIFFS